MSINITTPGVSKSYLDLTYLRLDATNDPITELLTLSKGLVVNETGIDNDTRIEAFGEPYALFIQGANGNVGIHTNIPSHGFSIGNKFVVDPTNGHLGIGSTPIVSTNFMADIRGGGGVGGLYLSSVDRSAIDAASWGGYNTFQGSNYGTALAGSFGVRRTTHGVSDVWQLIKFFSGTTGQVGDGVGFRYTIANDAGTNTVSSNTFNIFTDASAGAEYASFGIKNIRNGSLTEAWQVDSEGYGIYQSGLQINAREIDADTIISANSISYALFIQGSDGKVVVGSNTPHNVVNNKFQVAGGYIFIDSDQKLTIPSYRNQSFYQPSANTSKLSAYRDLEFASVLTGYSYIFNEAGNDTDFRIESSVSAYSFTINGATGYVGVGTNIASEIFEVSNTGDYQFRLTNLGAGGGFWNISQSDNSWGSGGSKLLFVPDTTNSINATVVFMNNGNVGIGSVSPTAQLHTTKGRIVGTNRYTTTQTLDADDHIVYCNTDSSAFTINLPVGVAGTYYRIINTGSSGNDITITPNGTELLTGINTSRTLSDSSIIILVYESTEGWW